MARPKSCTHTNLWHKETPFSLEAIMSIESYNYKTFERAYKDERKEILDDDVQDMRILQYGASIRT